MGGEAQPKASALTDTPQFKISQPDQADTTIFTAVFGRPPDRAYPLPISAPKRDHDEWLVPGGRVVRGSLRIRRRRRTPRTSQPGSGVRAAGVALPLPRNVGRGRQWPKPDARYRARGQVDRGPAMEPKTPAALARLRPYQTRTTRSGIGASPAPLHAAHRPPRNRATGRFRSSTSPNPPATRTSPCTRRHPDFINQVID